MSESWLIFPAWRLIENLNRKQNESLLIDITYCYTNIDSRALHNWRNFLHYLIPPILGAFDNNEKNILFKDIKQTIAQ